MQDSGEEGLADHPCGRLAERTLRAAFHWIVITGCRLLFLITCRVRVIRLAHVPSSGPLIMASNHISHFDPSMVSGFFPRPLDWLAMEELFGTPFWKRIFTWLNCIPVDRGGGDRRSLREALRRLEAGRVVGIFPEGGIRAGEWSVLNGAPMKPGLAALSLLSGAPVVPCVLIGTDRLYKTSAWLRRTTIWFLIGEAIEPPREGSSQELRRKLAEEISEAFVRMREEATVRFGLTSEDLPQTPQARKGRYP
jgi:1-acyl-sn-glycerol-3-phosphate acyltransferase